MGSLSPKWRTLSPTVESKMWALPLSSRPVSMDSMLYQVYLFLMPLSYLWNMICLWQRNWTPNSLTMLYDQELGSFPSHMPFHREGGWAWFFYLLSPLQLSTQACYSEDVWMPIRISELTLMLAGEHLGRREDYWYLFSCIPSSTWLQQAF